MGWNDTLTDLSHVLAGLYPFREESYRIVVKAGVPPEYVSFKDRPIDNWFQIILTASHRNKVLDVVEVALNEHPENSVLLEVKKENGELKPVKAPAVDKELPWKGDLSGENLEKIMGKQS